MDAKVIGKMLRDLRGDRTIKEVSEDLGISASALNMYELGERIPRDEVKVMLSKYYGFKIEKFFTL